ncbi:unnamed protein product [Prorocentrum cordatum]|uniref:ATP-dependent RNA helicase n=1 Tax=Prorocentrum cordatum TaxID=2364126 RepID=A0ABN9QLR6_9DINO|nr:unnamed protein product [Polarella glacialis]
MTAVQAAAIGPMLADNDVIVRAKTGTGKTLGFLVPMVENICKQPAGKGFISALIISPTRELAAQIAKEAEVLVNYHSLTASCVYGGVGKISKDMGKLANCDILVATPGRLQDHLDNTPGFTNKLSKLVVLTLDEADQLLDMGFKAALLRIFRCLPPAELRRTALFSATFPATVDQIGKSALRPNRLYINTVRPDEEETPDQIDQSVVTSDLAGMTTLLWRVLEFERLSSLTSKIIVFFNTAKSTAFFSEQFTAAGARCPTPVVLLAPKGAWQQERARGGLWVPPSQLRPSSQRRRVPAWASCPSAMGCVGDCPEGLWYALSCSYQFLGLRGLCATAGASSAPAVTRDRWQAPEHRPLPVWTEGGVEETEPAKGDHERQPPPGALAAMLAVLVLVNANDQIFKELSRSQGRFPYQVSSVILVASFLSVAGGLAACCAVHGVRAGLQQCLQVEQLRRCCIPSVLFTYAVLLRFAAVRFLGAGVLNVTEPVFGLGLSAVAAQLLKGGALRLRQVWALLCALLGLLWFLTLRGPGGPPAAPALVPAAGAGCDGGRASAACAPHAPLGSPLALGWLCMLGSAALGTAAGLAAERLLKQGGPAGRVSFLVRKTQLEVPAFFAALVSSLVLEPMVDAGAFQPVSVRPLSVLLRGWDRRTLLVLGAVLARSWLAAGIVKYLDTLRYSLTQVCGMLLTFFVLEAFASQGDLLGNLRRRPGAYSAVLVVAASIGAFASASAAPRPKASAPPHRAWGPRRGPLRQESASESSPCRS